VTLRYLRTEKNAPAFNFIAAHGIACGAKSAKGAVVLYEKGREIASGFKAAHIKVVMR